MKSEDLEKAISLIIAEEPCLIEEIEDQKLFGRQCFTVRPFWESPEG